MEIATQNIFMHDGKFCKQTDGVVMVSSLGPKLSNIFLLSWKLWLQQCHIPFKPHIYTFTQGL